MIHMIGIDCYSYKSIRMSMTIYEFVCVHIVTYEFIMENVCVFLNLTKTNLYKGDFKIMLQTHVILDFDERCTCPKACPQNTPFMRTLGFLMCYVITSKEIKFSLNGSS